MMTPPVSNILLLGFGNIGQALSAPLRARYPHLDIRVLDERMDAQQIAIAHAAGFTWDRAAREFADLMDLHFA